MKNIHNPPDITKLNKNEISNTDWHKPKEGEKRERRTKQKREKRQEEKTLKKTTEELGIDNKEFLILRSFNLKLLWGSG